MIHRAFSTVLLLAAAAGLSLGPSVLASELRCDIPTTPDGVVVALGGWRLRDKWTPPQVAESRIDGQPKPIWKALGRKRWEQRLAGRQGSLVEDMFTDGELVVARQVWVAAAGDSVAFRHRVTNRSGSALQLHSVSPLGLSGEEGLTLDGSSDLQRCAALLQERLKNGRPRALVPAAGTSVEADPCVVFAPSIGGSSQLLIGFLSQQGHLARIDASFADSEGGVLLESLRAECQLDGVRLPAGGERASQWVVVMSGDDVNAIMAEFADRVGDYHGVPEPEASAPSVFCTWYFHGRNYNQTFLAQDLEALRRNRIPFDVFLIDDCWANGNWGYWNHGDAFPDGMAAATQSIRAAGYRPGIWTAPYSVNMDSELAADHPEWLLKYRDGSRVVFGYAVKSWILDPTYPGVAEHLESVFRRLAEADGFSYFKCDFMRSVFVFDGVAFHDPEVARLEAYRLGLEAIRRGIGPDSYLSICGGHYGASLGLADSQRSGSDVVSVWEPDQIACFQQNFLRTWMSRLWHVDPDALMIRRRDTPYHDPNDKQSRLSLGLLTDAEARTFTLNQYLGGGMVCFSEYLPELQEDRRAMYRHVIPSINTPSSPLDAFAPGGPTECLTRVNPVAAGLQGWNTVSLMNWGESAMEGRVNMDASATVGLDAAHFLVSEFFGQRVIGVFAQGEDVDLGVIPPHESRLLRIAPWDGRTPVLAGTDLHFSGGGVEIASWSTSDDGLRAWGKLDTKWLYPVQIKVAFPAENAAGFVVATTQAHPGQHDFEINRPTSSAFGQ